VRDIKVVFVKIVILLFLTILIISTYFLIQDCVEYKTSYNENMKLIEDVIIEEDNENIIEIDWENLEKINSDIVGWIKINNTNINYPILKDDNDLKYLKYSFNGKYNSNGSIFTLDNEPFKENKTNIYGHNMKNRLMFSDLDKFMKEEFFKENTRFDIYTKEQNYKAIIFSYYSIGVNEEENNIKLLNFNEEIDYYKNISKYKVEDIGEIKKIVKISTCSYLNNPTTPTNQRYYLIAKLEKV